MKQTTHYKLYKPEGKDSFNIDYENSNMDTIDAAMKRIENNVALNNIKLNITTDSKLVGRTITIDNGTYTYIETVPSSMKVVVNVPETGSWFIHNPVTGRDKEVVCKYLGEYDVDLRCYTVYSAIIDHTILDPRDCITYADDAEGMEKGNYEQWYNAPIFKDIKNCLLVEGKFQGYLKRDTVNAFEDGTQADITTLGNDVMVEFPRIGYKIGWLDDNRLKVSITDEPNAEGFDYHAFSLDGYNDCDKIYLATYGSSITSNKMYSSSGKAHTVKVDMNNERTYAQNRGPGFQLWNYWHKNLLQCLYIIFFGDLNCQDEVGYGYVKDGQTAKKDNTGLTNTYGFMSEKIRETNLTLMTNKANPVKCFGLENLWGNIIIRLDGCRIQNNTERNLLIAPYASMVINSSSYTNYDNYGSYNWTSAGVSGYMRRPVGDNYGAFMAEIGNGSATTLYCDTSNPSEYYPGMGAYYAHGTSGGIFYNGGNSGSAEDTSWASRLAFFHKEYQSLMGENQWYINRVASTSNTYAAVAAKATVHKFLLHDNRVSTALNLADSYTAQCTTYIYVDNDVNLSVKLQIDDAGQLFVNKTAIDSSVSGARDVVLPCKKGWNEITVIYTEKSGNDGFQFTPKLTDLAQVKRMNAFANE